MVAGLSIPPKANGYNTQGSVDMQPLPSPTVSSAMAAAAAAPLAYLAAGPGLSPNMTHMQQQQQAGPLSSSYGRQPSSGLAYGGVATSVGSMGRGNAAGYGANPMQKAAAVALRDFAGDSFEEDY